MVYAYIIEEGVYQCEGSAKHGKTTRWQPKRHPASPAHLQDIENIGEPTLFELGLFYYQVTTFKFSGDASSQCRRLGKILLHTPDPWQSGRQLLNLVRKIELSVEQHELKSYNKEFPTLLSTFMVSMQCKVAIRVSITLDNNVALASACVMRADALDCVIRFGDTISKLYPNSEQLKQKGHRCKKTHGVILGNLSVSRDALEGLMRDDEKCVVELVNCDQSEFRDKHDLASLAAIRQKHGRGEK